MLLVTYNRFKIQRHLPSMWHPKVVFVFKSRLRFLIKYFCHFMDLVKKYFWWNRSVNRAVERTMQTIAPPSFSCHKIVSSMSNNEGGETAIMSRKKRDVIYIFSHPPFKRSFLCVWEKNQYSLFYCFSKLETKETIMSRKKGILQSCA